MRLHNLAVAVAALSIAGAAVAAGNDTSTTTTGASNGSSSSGQTSSSQQGAQSGSSQMGSSQSGSASGEQSNPALVRSAQQALKQKGYDVGTIDGQLGPTTDSALRNFQQAQGLPQSGTLDQQTLSALGVDQNQSSMSNQGSQGTTSDQGSQSGSTSSQGSQGQGAMQNQGSATKTSGSYKEQRAYDGTGALAAVPAHLCCGPAEVRHDRTSMLCASLRPSRCALCTQFLEMRVSFALADAAQLRDDRQLLGAGTRMALLPVVDRLRTDTHELRVFRSR
jgi:peptidoglycan hydrolase-like protein with peptidoglycan-binding domain